MCFVRVVSPLGANHWSSNSLFVWQSQTSCRFPANSRLTVRRFSSLSTRKSNWSSGRIGFTFQLIQESVQFFIAARPQRPLFIEPALCGRQLLPLEHARPDAARLGGADQAGVLQHADVLHERGQ